MSKKEKQINNYQEICKKQEKEIINLLNQNKNMNNYNKNSSNEKIYNKFVNQNINNEIFFIDSSNNMRNYIYDFSDNKEELTMDKKYDFLFQNKKK